MQTQSRIVGSGFTTVSWGNTPIALLDQFTDDGQPPFGGAGYNAITPIGWNRPMEIVTTEVLAEGTMTVRLIETWFEPVWYRLQDNIRNTQNIVDVWMALRLDPNPITITMIIKPPGAPQWRGKVYNNCVITSIPDGETITVGALSTSKDVRVVYTHTTPFTGAAAA